MRGNDDVDTRLDQLERQAAEMQELRDELARLRASNFELDGWRRSLEERLRRPRPEGGGTRAGRGKILRPGDPATDAEAEGISRRRLLRRLGAAGAAGAGLAAASSLGRARPAGATTGNFQYGTDSFQDAGLDWTGLTSKTTAATLDVKNESAGGHGVRGTGVGGSFYGVYGLNVTGSGVRGDSGDTASHGVYGYNGATGGGNGVYGESQANTGYGVYGINDAAGIGVFGNGGTGVKGQGGANGGFGVYGIATAAGSGVKGETGSGGDWGVRGVNTNGGTGIYGSGGSAGIYGDSGSATGFGAQGNNTAGGTGVQGQTNSTNRYGVEGVNNGTGAGVSGTGGIGVRAQGSVAPLLLVPSAASGPPVAGTHSRGEIYVDSTGTAFQCVSAGTPGTWRKLAAGAPGFATASGSINLLANPIRLLDTRGSTGGHPGKLVPNTNPANQLDLLVTGVVVGGVSVPAGAVAVLGNLAVTDTENTSGFGGYLSAYAKGRRNPNAAVLNWTDVNQSVNNLVLSALDATGTMTIENGTLGGSSATNVVLDVVGFVM